MLPRPRAFLAAVLTLAPVAALLAETAAEDAMCSAAAEACRRALAYEQPIEARGVLAGMPGGPLRAVLAARIDCALGHPSAAAVDLGVRPGADLDAVVAAWPIATRGEAAQTAAEIALALGCCADAHTLAANARAAGDEGVEPDRCLALDMDAFASSGHALQAEAVAMELWRSWGGSRYHARAGLLVAGSLAPHDPERAREVLAEVRADALSGPVRLAASELLCSLLLQERPGECEVVASQELARPGAAPGALPLWRALSLARLDAASGLAALAALPPALAADPAVAPAIARARARQEDTLALVIQRAVARAGLGDPAGARAMLAELARTQPAALIALLGLPGCDAEPYRGAPAAADESAALALSEALARAGDGVGAYETAAPALAHAAKGPRAAALLAVAAASSPDALERRRLRARLFVDPVAGALAVGLAWCDEAQDRQDRGLDATTAWAAAAHALPSRHPWQAEAAWRAARAQAASGEDHAARELLEGAASWGGDGAAHCRCRFLLAQVLARLGDLPGALRAAASLNGLGDAQQQQRLDVLMQQLRAQPPGSQRSTGM